MSREAIPFHKMVASGNDFVVVDNRAKLIQDPVRFARKVCERHNGIGADGVLLLENSRKADFKMRIINSDGSEAEACGNGFRCIALFAKEKIGLPLRFQFESVSGLVQAEICGRRVRVQLPDPKDYLASGVLEVLDHRLHYAFINTGVPHTVIFVEGLEKMEIGALGRSIRNLAIFQPKGTNVNFVELGGKSKIHVRTYERGVEQETLACGTGSTASAIISTLAGYTRPPVQVKTRSGEILTVDFSQNKNRVSQVSLEGEAHLVFDGSFEMNHD